MRGGFRRFDNNPGWRQMKIKQVVGAALAAWGLMAALPSQAALVQYRLSGWVTMSGVFDDGTTVAEGTPVTVSFSYETKTAASLLERHEDGSGNASYDIAAPYRFKLRVGNHHARTQAYQVSLYDNLNQPFGDTFDLLSRGGATIDGRFDPGASLAVSLLSQGGHLDALDSLKLPKHLKEWSFDAFRVGRLAAAGDRTLVMFVIDRIKSTVCAEAVPGTDTCAE